MLRKAERGNKRGEFMRIRKKHIDLLIQKKLNYGN